MKQCTTAHPFHFYSRLNLLELTGVQARTARGLLRGIKKAPGAVIYHHTHHFLQRHQRLSPEPPNDFAYWVTRILGDDDLGERLASIDLCQFSTIGGLKVALVDCLEGYLGEHGQQRSAPPGREFQFIKAVTFILPTGHVASDLEEFWQTIEQITVNSLYFHMFEARLRLGKRTNHFSLWLEESLGETDLARAIDRLDPYTHTMEGLRQRILTLMERRREVSSARVG